MKSGHVENDVLTNCFDLARSDLVDTTGKSPYAKIAGRNITDHDDRPTRKPAAAPDRVGRTQEQSDAVTAKETQEPVTSGNATKGPAASADPLSESRRETDNNTTQGSRRPDPGAKPRCYGKRNARTGNVRKCNERTGG